MAQNVKLIVYPVSDLDASKAFFSTFLGVEPYAQSPYYVGFKVDDSLEVGLDPNSQTIIAYTEVEDVNESLQALLDSGAEMYLDAKDVGGGMLIAQVKDANGNILGLRQLPK